MTKAARWILLALPPLCSAFLVYVGAFGLLSLADAIGITGRWFFGVQLIVVGPLALVLPATLASLLVDNLVTTRPTLRVWLRTIELILVFVAWQQTFVALDLGWS